MATNENLTVGNFLANLKWDEENALISLDSLYQFAYKETKSTEEWYWKKAGGKRFWAMGIRLVAIAAVTAAGLIPILTPIWQNSAGDPVINPVWSSVAVAIGTAALGLDKYFGFSSGWIRYVTSALSVKGWMIEFKYDWELNRAIMLADDNEYSEPEIQSMITKCSAFALKISNAVQEETKQWAQEFQTGLGALGETLKQQASIGQPGGVIINLENGDKCTAGWEIQVDGRKLGKHYGNTGVLTDLYPGLHQIVIAGDIGKKSLHAETAINIEVGVVSTINLKLT